MTAYDQELPASPSLPGIIDEERGLRIRVTCDVFKDSLLKEIAGIDNPVRQLRIRLNLEEFFEYLEAETFNDLVHIASELADNAVVQTGTANAYGFSLSDVFEEIHRANLSKMGDDGRPVKNEYGKVIKGPNFKKADIRKVIYGEQGE